MQAVAGDAVGHVDERLGGLLDEDAWEEMEVLGVGLLHDTVSRERVGEGCTAMLLLLYLKSTKYLKSVKCVGILHRNLFTSVCGRVGRVHILYDCSEGCNS